VKGRRRDLDDVRTKRHDLVFVATACSVYANESDMSSELSVSRVHDSRIDAYAEGEHLTLGD
jgi:hypothetical protein